jgi:hypothetical protein
MSIKVMKTRRKLFGQEHEETLSGIAMVYSLAGRCYEAEELEVQVMETRNRVAGHGASFHADQHGNLAFT